jgi:hypothetical protein
MWHFLLKCAVRRKYLVVAYQSNSQLKRFGGGLTVAAILVNSQEAKSRYKLENRFPPGKSGKIQATTLLGREWTWTATDCSE